MQRRVEEALISVVENCVAYQAGQFFVANRCG
jgi:hypothetical protein